MYHRASLAHPIKTATYYDEQDPKNAGKHAHSGLQNLWDEPYDVNGERPDAPVAGWVSFPTGPFKPSHGAWPRLWGLTGNVVGKWATWRPCELAAFRLHEPGILALGFYLPEHCGVKSGVRGRAVGRGPVLLAAHLLDQLLAIHRLALLAQHLGGGVQGADLLGLGFGLGLRSFGSWRALGRRRVALRSAAVAASVSAAFLALGAFAWAGSSSRTWSFLLSREWFTPADTT